MTVHRATSDEWRADDTTFSVRRAPTDIEGTARLYTGHGVECGIPQTRTEMLALADLLLRVVNDLFPATTP